jgi:hypothetical protein
MGTGAGTCMVVGWPRFLFAGLFEHMQPCMAVVVVVWW